MGNLGRRWETLRKEVIPSRELDGGDAHVGPAVPSRAFVGRASGEAEPRALEMIKQGALLTSEVLRLRKLAKKLSVTQWDRRLGASDRSSRLIQMIAQRYHGHCNARYVLETGYGYPSVTAIKGDDMIWRQDYGNLSEAELEVYVRSFVQVAAKLAAVAEKEAVGLPIWHPARHDEDALRKLEGLICTHFLQGEYPMHDIVKFLNDAPSRRLSPNFDDGNERDKTLASLRKTQVHEVMTAYESMCSIHDDTAWGVVVEQGAAIRASVDAY